jgi:hypothetical protein
MDHPPRKDYSEMSNFNFTGPYEPYRDQHPLNSKRGFNDSSERLVDSAYHDKPRHSRNTSRGSRGSRDSHGSPDGRKPTAPGYGFAY